MFMRIAILMSSFFFSMLFASSLSYAKKIDDLDLQWKEAKLAYKAENYKKSYEIASSLATEHHHAEAELLLATMYYHGYGIQSDQKKSMYWLKLAASHGVAEAQAHLANFYLRGHEALPKNEKYAYLWISLALKNGFKHPSLSDSIAKFRKKFTAKELKTLNQKIEQCMATKYKHCES
jgi:TPR repeat protein